MKYYAEPGQSLQIVYEDHMEPDDGLVRMDNERPSEFHICKNNFDGTGRWELDTKLQKRAKWPRAIHFAKNVLAFINYKRHKHLALRAHQRPKSITTCILQKNKLDAFAFLSLLFILIYYTSTKPQNTTPLIENILWVIIIPFVLWVYFPSAQRRQNAAEEIHRNVLKISDLKNAQYISIKFKKHLPVIKTKNLSLSPQRADILRTKITENANTKPEINCANINQHKTNEEFFEWSLTEYERLLIEASNITDIDKFPRIQKTVNNGLELLSSSKLLLTNLTMSDVHYAEMYVSNIFRTIEKLQLDCQLEAGKYRTNLKLFSLNYYEPINFDVAGFEYLYSEFPI